MKIQSSNCHNMCSVAISGVIGIWCRHGIEHVFFFQYQEKYKNVRLQNDLPPHIYGMADKVFQRMRRTKTSQTIAISGESGAGKTECAKYALQQLAYLSAAPANNLHEKIIKVRFYFRRVFCVSFCSFFCVSSVLLFIQLLLFVD